MHEGRSGLVIQNMHGGRLGLVIQNMRERSIRFHRQDLSASVRAAPDGGYPLFSAPRSLGHQSFALLHENPVKLFSGVFRNETVVLYSIPLAFPGKAPLGHDQNIAGKFEHGHQDTFAGFAEFDVQDRFGRLQHDVLGRVFEEGHKQHDAAANLGESVLVHREPCFETLLHNDAAAHWKGSVPQFLAVNPQKNQCR
ncbi:unnamed protein product, partial [Ixodes hexagonus]